MGWISKLIDSVSERGKEIWQQESHNRNALPNSIADDCRELLTRQGDAVALAIAKDILQRYQHSSNKEKMDFFQYLQELEPDFNQVSKLAQSYAESSSIESYQSLCANLNSGRKALFELLNIPGEGTASLVSLREDLLKHMKIHPELKVVDIDLQSTLQSWFNRGFLEFRSISWETPAFILEKLIEYEAVHEIRDWEELKRRLEDDRGCFAFFHPALPGEPLIFVQVAYTKGISGDVAPFLDKNTPLETNSTADTAIFYSISNCQTGLKGISFGNFLIKQVVQEILKKRPEIHQFSTLSPMPALSTALVKGEVDEAILEALAGKKGHQLKERYGVDTFAALLTEKAGSLQPDDNQAFSWLEDVGFYYLTQVKKGQEPYDPVARFHLSNGAAIYRINPFANLKPHGLKSSAGLMVNYIYELSTLEINHEHFKQDGTIATYRHHNRRNKIKRVEHAGK